MQLSIKIRSSTSGSSTVVQNLRTLEEAVNELLHTLFPDTFDAELTPVNSESNLISESSATTELSSMSEQGLGISFTPNATVTPTPLTTSHTSHITPSHSLFYQDEVDYISPSQSNPLAHPIKSESPTSKISAWRQTSVHQVEEELPFMGRSSIKKARGTPAAGQQEARVFVAVLDYEPESMCVTGKPSDELSFNTGECA